ncbi:MAG: hypothetical protein Q7T71_00530, partial [Herbiconiux sp.]|nr:hypothetical protein [Herbiconiux sp.]
EAGIPVIGHARIPEHFARFEAPRLAAVQAAPATEPDKAWEAVRLTAPTVLVPAGTDTHLVLGGRAIELVPLAPGHTDTDLAVHVPDARAWMLGDVIEQSGAPTFGSGSFPLGWGASLEALLTRIGPDDVLVPGHGAAVGRAFAADQAALLSEVAALIRTAHAADPTSANAGDAAAARSLTDRVDSVVLPTALSALWPDWMLRSALRAGFAQLDRPG